MAWNRMLVATVLACLASPPSTAEAWPSADHADENLAPEEESPWKRTGDPADAGGVLAVFGAIAAAALIAAGRSALARRAWRPVATAGSRPGSADDMLAAAARFPASSPVAAVIVIVAASLVSYGACVSSYTVTEAARYITPAAFAAALAVFDLVRGRRYARAIFAHDAATTHIGRYIVVAQHGCLIAWQRAPSSSLPVARIVLDRLGPGR